MTLGKMADAAREVAIRKGHHLSSWSEGRDMNGMKWTAHCLDCGAMATAENLGGGAVGRFGSTQVRTCEAVQKSKQRRKLLRRGE